MSFRAEGEESWPLDTLRFLAALGMTAALQHVQRLAPHDSSLLVARVRQMDLVLEVARYTGAPLSRHLQPAVARVDEMQCAGRIGRSAGRHDRLQQGGQTIDQRGCDTQAVGFRDGVLLHRRQEPWAKRTSLC